MERRAEGGAPAAGSGGAWSRGEKVVLNAMRRRNSDLLGRGHGVHGNNVPMPSVGESQGPSKGRERQGLRTGTDLQAEKGSGAQASNHRIYDD